ncbi:hypothetical protein AMAG_18576 [Allomyces macrogynus ATCC 38327]|uniref:Kinetochore protein Nuf2 N-terminal domain-containing protein n=1 Tax=Allomyces macrogynus (strain ATCC 38327) TaxID=578462 RepID=A0A0L0SDT4_ALLM3|nr:hypothetical protein AMAG_18576 [Allomyces macrogynus ATCC 38327]|eukprot:KNE60646.1 hypothetical protein AMAG_18576 [Allomyces macrogynus ATCC 38327]
MNRRSPVIPILRGAELNNALRDLGLGHLSEDALLRGTNTLLPALQQFVEILRGVAYQDLEEAGHKIMEAVTRHPDLYPDLRVQVTVVKHIRHILRDMGFPDFSLRDVQRPTPDRLRKVFSYLIAFKRQGEMWLLRHQEHQALLNKIELRRLEVFDEHDQLTAQKQQRIEKDRRDKEEAKAVGKRNIELDREAAAARRAYEAKVKSIKQAEEDAEAIKDDIATRTTELQSLEAEVRQLEKWVIDDPDAWHAISHKDEGFAMDWSSKVEGQLLTGDCSKMIKLSVASPTGFNTTMAFAAHKKSVEDLQWSPSEATVFASSSADGTVKIFDTRMGSKPGISATVADCDVNVISWNRLTPFLLASGHDDGSFAVWDLREFARASNKANVRCAPAAQFAWHRAPVTSIEWHTHEESMLAVAGDDNQVTLWDLKQRLQLAKELAVRKAECEEALQALDLARNQQMIVDDAAAEEARNIEQVKAATQAMRDKYLAECAVIEAKYEVLAQTVVKYVDAMEAQMGQSVMFSADEDEEGVEVNAMEL